MLQRIVILSFIVLSCFIISCNSRVSALKLSNGLTRINDSLAQYGKEWGDEFKKAYETSDFSGLYPIRAKMEGYVNRKMECVNSMKDVKGSQEFRQKELEYLQYEKVLISNQFTRFEYFNDLTAPADLENAFNDLMAASKKEQEILEQLHIEVRKYADKNDIDTL